MYPFLLGCFVMGIVTPDQLITNVPYQDLPFRYKKAFHRDYYMSLNTNVHDFYFSQMGVLFKESMMYFALIYLESEVRKDSLGNIYSLKPRMAAIPLNLLIDTNVMPKYRGKIDYSPKDLTKEFLMHSEVVINIGPPAGSLARVVGYKSETSDFDNVEVKIIKTPPKLGAVTTAIAAKYDDHRNYRSVYHVAKRLGVDVQVVLHVLDRLIIKTEASLNTKSLYPERFDIGLNFIHRKNHTIVAELVICNELRKQRKSRYRTFTHFQLAPEAINLLKNYYTNHKAVFEAIANKIRLGDPSPLTAKFIFPNAEDPNLEAFKIYVWILKQENSNLSLTNKASKVIPREGIRELEKVLGGSKNYLGEQAKHILNKVFPYNPNFLIPKSADNWVPPFYSKQPPWHKLGDRVVNLRINGCNFAPFGAVGTVVGILGNKPENGLWKVKIEVMFDYPFIGGTNLGGRCSWGRGAVINFDDIFNLKRWEKCIQARDPKRSFFNQSWDGVFPNSYVPSFQTASEISDTEEDSARVNQPNFPKSTILPEDLLLKHLSDNKKEAEKREVLRKKNKSQTTKRPEKRESSPTKTSIVPKTLGLLKKAENQNEEILVKETVEKATEIKVIKPFNEDAFREPSPDTQNKLDFNTLINNTLPPTLNTETLQNTSFSISSRFSIGNTSMPDLASHMRSPVYHTWAQDEESILDMKEDLYKMNTMQSKTPNILKSDRIETLRKIGDRRNTIEPLIDFGFKPIKVAEKENIQNTMYKLRREAEVENNDTEDGGAEQIFIEVSQGGRLVKEETITLEIVERKDVKLG